MFLYTEPHVLNIIVNIHQNSIGTFFKFAVRSIGTLNLIFNITLGTRFSKPDMEFFSFQSQSFSYIYSVRSDNIHPVLSFVDMTGLSETQSKKSLWCGSSPAEDLKESQGLAHHLLTIRLVRLVCITNTFLSVLWLQNKYNGQKWCSNKCLQNIDCCKEHYKLKWKFKLTTNLSSIKGKKKKNWSCRKKILGRKSRNW